MDPHSQLDEIMPIMNDLVRPLTEAQLQSPTPCTDFSVQGLLDHLNAGAGFFAAAFRGEAPPPPADPAGTDRVAEFPTAMTTLQAAVRSPGALGRTTTAPFGEVPGEAFARFLAFDVLVHGWDIATGTGQPYGPNEQLVAEVDAFARQAITGELRSRGAFGPEVEPPAGASPLSQLIAFTGRDSEGHQP